VFVGELRLGLRRLAQDDSAGIAQFQAAMGAYVALMQGHIQREETVLFPVAQQTLQEEDWDEIDAAFAVNLEELAGVRADFQALMARIAHLAPTPIGLGLVPNGRVPGAAQIDSRPRAPLHTRANQRPDPQPDSGAGLAALEVRDLTSHYGRIAALRGITLDIGTGQLVALVGANGAGKSTLLRTISGVQRASAGRICFGGEDITRLRPDKRVRLGIGHVPEGRQVFGPLSVADNLRLGAYTCRDRRAIAEDLERMYAMFPVLKQRAHLPAGMLSGGQQQMLAMARALMGRPRLLLLDEPSMGLAPLLVDEIFNVISELRRQAMTIFLVEQNAHAALAIADYAYVIETGKIVLCGTGQALRNNDRVKEAYLGI
jgi:branched-chain amino acid transport system ATP-binding protein